MLASRHLICRIYTHLHAEVGAMVERVQQLVRHASETGGERVRCYATGNFCQSVQGPAAEIFQWRSALNCMKSYCFRSSSLILSLIPVEDWCNNGWAKVSCGWT